MADNMNERLLIAPSADVPWSVEVISTMPKELVEKPLDFDTGAVTADGPSWVCLGLSSEGKFFVYPQNAVPPPRRVSSSTTTATGMDQLDQSNSSNHSNMNDDVLLLPPKYVGHLCQQKLKSEEASCFVCLEERDKQAVQIYVLHPTTGFLFCKRLLPIQVHTKIMMPFAAYTRIEVQPPEVLTCLRTLHPASAGLLVVGSSTGRLWLAKCTIVPMTLKIYPLEYDMESHNNTSSSSFSLLGRIFGTTPSKKKMRYDDSESSSLLSMGVQAILPLPTTAASSSSATFATSPILPASPSTALARFWMVTKGGTVVAFEPANDSTDELPQPWNYSSRVLGHLGDAFPQTDVPSSLEVLQAAVDPTLLYDPQQNNGRPKVVGHFLVQTQGRLYWMTTTATSSTSGPLSSANDLRVIRVHWLNRFPDGVTIQVGGLVVAENRMAYAALSSPTSGAGAALGGPVLVMALDSTKLPLNGTNAEQSVQEEDDDDDEVAIYEVDLPLTQVPSLLPNTLTLDVVTHGCTLLASSGLGLRIRCLPPPPTKSRPRLHTQVNRNQATSPSTLVSPEPASNSTLSSSKILTLASHLRSAFWHAYQHYEGATGIFSAVAPAMPPSLEQASVAHLEVAVVNVSQQLQQQAGDSSSHNPLDWHLAYINFLQQGGLYRRLSTETRYKLLGMGQEVVVFSNLLQQTNQQQEILTARLQPHGIALWFYDILQRHQFFNISSSTKEQQDARVLWCSWLCLALKAATAFRLDKAISFYDIPADPEPWIKSTQLAAAVAGTQYLWTSDKHLQIAMVELLQFWKRVQITSVQHGLIETIVQSALQSHMDSCFSVEDQESYAQTKVLAIPLLRKMIGRDDLAFALSIDHCYFEGLCQIVNDHEKQYDQNNFSLDTTLFTKLQDCVDTTTGLAFGPFCLQWFADRGLYGHVLNYGHHGCPNPDDLRNLLQRDGRLRSFRWINAIRKSDYVAATEHLLTTVKDPDVSYSDLNLSVSLAKLSNLVVEHEGVTERSVTAARRRFIESRQEQILAQVILSSEHSYYSDDHYSSIDASAPFHLRSADELLTWTLDEKLNQVKGQDERVQYCMLGLGICNTMGNKNSEDGDDATSSEVELGATRLWAKAILLESPLWLEWIHTQPDLTDPELIDLILDSTTFGKLLKQCWMDPSMVKSVAFGPSMERNVLLQLKWDHVATTEMQRLLQHVCRQGRKTAQ